MAKMIPLSRGQFATVDDEDFEWLNQHTWYARVSPRRHAADHFYACTHLQKFGRKTTVPMHRMILGRMGFPGHVVPDHRDGDGLNNQRENLRPATQGQNVRNRAKSPGTASRFKGVHWDRLTSKWRAQIEANGRKHHLGRFLSEEDAACAYDAAAFALFGEFARPNFPNRIEEGS